jgi:hypothetical protein
MGVELLASPSALVQCVVAMLRPMSFCTVEYGQHVCLDLRREGVR